MTVTIQQVSNTNTFEFWINRTNELANAMTTVAVTTNSNTAVGNAAVSNTFTANTLVATSVRVSNTTSNVVIIPPTTSQISSAVYYLNANGSWAQIDTPLIAGSFTTTGITQQEIDNYDMSLVNAAEYYIHIKNNNANGYQATKLLTVHSGVGTTTALSTEYAVVTTNTTLGTFAVTSNGTNVKLLMTPGSTNTTVTFSRVNF